MLTFCSIINCMCIAWKVYPRNDLHCVGRDVKPYSLTFTIFSNTYLS